MSAPAEAAPDYDLVVIGGGVNGCGIARDAAGRGLSVLLVERADLAGATSSASTKLIHGGLRYLEYGAFSLVRESLRERERLLRLAPHLVRPMRFVLPLGPAGAGRPAWMLRLGLALYDRLGGARALPPSRRLRLRDHPAGAPLKPDFAHAFEYSDGWVDDSRLVALNALDAAERGARVATRAECVAGVRAQGLWRLRLEHRGPRGERETVTARALVNAAGPWAGQVLAGALRRPAPERLRLVRGSHIVVPRLFAHEGAYLLQTPDRRVVFAVAFERDFTLIGTTEMEHEGDPGAAAIAPEETAYLCAAASAYFARAVTPADVVHAFSGVRPLNDEPGIPARAASRDYTLELEEGEAGTAPLVTVIGGKLTTYRRLAEAALAMLASPLGLRAPAWTAHAPLPGGDFAPGEYAAARADFHARYPFLAEADAERLFAAYGTRADAVLGPARRRADLGRDLGHGLSARELAYLMDREWARTAEDVLWRRGKLGLRFTREQTRALQAHMHARAPALAGEGPAETERREKA